MADADMQRALDALEEERLARVEMTKAAFVKRRSLIEQDMERSRILRLRPSLPSLSAARRGAAKRFGRQSSEAAPGGDGEPARYGWGGGGDGESATPGRAAFDESPRRASDPGPRSGSPSYLDDDTGTMDTGQTVHSGCPVIEGEKWVVTLWMRKGVHEDDAWSQYDPTGARHL